MPVGKGSITRAIKSQTQETEEKAVVTTEAKEAEKKPEGKAPAKRKMTAGTSAEKKTAAAKPAKEKVTVKKASVHEEKFGVISHIQCELPTYLL